MKKLSLFIVVAVCSGLCTQMLGMEQTNSIHVASYFYPGQIWRDTAGQPINAHGGGMLFHEGVYYWYGEFKQGRTYLAKVNKSWGGTRVIAGGVSCYSSTNLHDWKNEGVVLPSVSEDPDHDLACENVIERPKVIYNAKTKKFVMWLHQDSPNYAAARSGVAVSDTPIGPFIYVGSFRPNAEIWPGGINDVDKQPGPTNYLARDFEGGQMARDMTLFVDDDGKAYQFYASEENATMHISQLTDDYLKPAGKYARIFAGRSMEAPAVFKRNGKYYLIASGCTGWDANSARSAVADNIFGPWTELGNPCRGADADKTFFCQSTFVMPVMGRTNEFIAMFDRWQKWNLQDSRYVWLPLEFDADDKPILRWQDRWTFPDLTVFPIVGVFAGGGARLGALNDSENNSVASPHTFTIGTNDFLLDGRKFQIRCGEIHAARVPKEYWRHRLQMVKAMGLNTVCAYLFWNLHEPKPGEFNWSGQADAAEFCRIAQEEGLWVILRPGPYACAEWEMGGTPWWMLKDDGIKLRSTDPRYLEPAKRFLKEVGRVLAPQQITHGGNIIMVQVENEYGFFGKDTNYVGELKKALLNAGFDVPLFQCNPPDQMKNGLLPDLYQAGNFGSDVEKNFAKVRKIQTNGPLMCSEFYPGWFDTWGQPHHLGKPENYLPNLKRMLDMGASFSIYMAHGGTTFGLWSGCDRPFKPDTSSYDYDAPISEAGWATPKFFATRALFSKYLLPGETLPEPPAPNPIIGFVPVKLNKVAPVFENLPSPIQNAVPPSMEKYDQGFGCILYRTKIPAGGATTFEAAAIHDFGYVFLDGKRIGILDRRSGNAKLALSAREKESQLDILVEPMGRVNFGSEMMDPKGLIAPVKLSGETLKNWQVFKLLLDDQMLGGLKFSAGKTDLPAFWRGTFTLEKPGDTFLDLRNWSKGVVWVNGHCLARFWNIGPSQTAYLPGCWLRAGANELVILDYLGPEKPVVAGLEKPVLDELHPEKDFARVHRPTVKLNLADAKPVQIGTFAPGGDTQEIKFVAPATGKFFCIESLNAQDGKPYAAIAELDLLDASGNAVSHNGWTVAYVDSEERVGEDGVAENAIDGQTANYWHTEWKEAQPDHPHRLILNLGKPQTISGIRYVPRQGQGWGRIKDYRVFINDQLIQP